jgi:serine/threonine-protein kinase
VLSPRYATNESLVARFQAEARSIARLRHPCIVEAYDVGRDGDLNYIVMELVPGRTLKELLADGPLTVAQTVNVGVQVAQALDHAHGEHIVHRDVKSQNVLVAEDGSVKLVDFGIAAMLEAQDDDSGPVLGTVHYLAPERARGEAATGATDIYSFGIVLYEMATGRLPFDGDSPGEIAQKQVSDAPLAPSRIQPTVPGYVEDAILWALAKEPTERPSAGELARKLLQIEQPSFAETRVVPIQPRPTAAHAPAPPPRQVRPAQQTVVVQRSSDWPLVALAVTAIVLVLGLIPLWATVLEKWRM